MIRAYKRMIKNSFNISGRTGRRDYWLAVFVNIIIWIIINLSLGVLGAIGISLDILMIVFSLLYIFLVLIPMFTMGVRRLHDTGRSAWCFLAGFIPFFGWVFLLIMFLLKGDPGLNRYGLNTDYEP